MAKQQNKKAARKKKPSNPTARKADYAITLACEKVLNEMYLTFSSVHSEISRHGMEQLNHLLKNSETKRVGGFFSKGRSDLTVARSALLADLSETTRVWNYWVGVFVENGDEVSCEIMAGSMKDTTMGDLTNLMPELVAVVLDDCDEDGNTLVTNENMRGWAWIATPSNQLDFAGDDEFTTRTFIENFDILNQELREQTKLIHQEKYISEQEQVKAA